jgi:DNA recombination protein RmuC
MDIVFLLIGLAVGALVGWLIGKNKSNENQAPEVDLENDFVRKERFEDLKKSEEKLSLDLDEKQDELVSLSKEVVVWQERYAALEENLKSQKEESEKLQEKFKNDFKVLAQEILDKNSKSFTEHNKKVIDFILNPFKEKLQSLEKKGDDNYEKGQKERITLKAEVKNLIDMNEKLSKDATNLTKALKGDVKTQGNWGEVILERILEKSGLVKDREYYVQNSLTGENGKLYRPDVIIHLPDNKKVIIDSKVSLVAYEKFSTADDLEEQKSHLKQHIVSIKAHVKGLSDKNYQNLYGVDGLDFVLLFIPIEGAFSAALQADNSLFQEAFDKNVVLVSTSTLLATLKTIASIWKQEYQNQNAVEIARQGGDLYDKFVNFSDDLITLGKQLNTAKGTYDGAMNKLSEGKGNLVSRSEKMRKLGLKTSKQMNQKLADRSADNGIEE